VQTFALGLIGELIIFTHGNKMKEYSVRRIIDGKSDAEQGSPVAVAKVEQA
jgi:hypothetical protein